MQRKIKTMDGNNAAAHVAYAFTEVAPIYPITPSSPMAEAMDNWVIEGRKNIFGQKVKLIRMQSEGGAAGAMHGALSAGAIATTFTASQGLLLMLPNMYKMAGELLPAVIHVSARAIATHALSIFGDHSDVMAARQTGFAMLCANNPQEIMDLAAVAHLSAIKGRVPFIHFFDGFRSSHQIDKIGVWDYEELKSMADSRAIEAFRKRALNPAHPYLKGSAQNPDIFFQNREASNIFYFNLPSIVKSYMNEVNNRLGTNYSLVNYYGSPNAERVIAAMGSVCDTVEETVDYLISQGEKVGLLKIRLYRPFPKDELIKAVPKACRAIAVLDRTKEPGAIGEPLYTDISAAYCNEKNAPIIVGGRYGLGSKDTLPADIFAVFDNLKAKVPKNGFTLAITDDVTDLSLERKPCPDTSADGNISCKFWGLGSDGTVGANKNSVKIIGDNTGLYVQAYFSYDSKKSGGITVSHLRFGKKPIKSAYLINRANFAACHSTAYINKYDIVQEVLPGGTFLLNCPWDESLLSAKLPAKMKRYIAENRINFYTVDATSIAEKLGLGNKTSVILQSAFFKLSNVISFEEAAQLMEWSVRETFSPKGEDVVEKNIAAISMGAAQVKKINVPSEWVNATDEKSNRTEQGTSFVEKILRPCEKQMGNLLPVSAFLGMEDGRLPLGTSDYEKRGISNRVPVWDNEKCIMCNRCSISCPHAALIATAMDNTEVQNAPGKMKLKKMPKSEFMFAIVISPFDCTGCGNCISVCPDKAKALSFEPFSAAETQQRFFDYTVKKVHEKKELLTPVNARSTQFKKPLLEFSGACPGCGETPYVKLITQICGDKMYISNATGCSSIWGGSAPSVPYTYDEKNNGPAWANSLFEDNAEHGLGIQIAAEHIRKRLSEEISVIDNEDVKKAYRPWLESYNDAEKNSEATLELIKALEKFEGEKAAAILNEREYLAKKAVWIIGGDGWAYDIGFGGLDHVLASGEDVNILVLDTEVYSNTGGQASKATPAGAVALFASEGKEQPKKRLAEMAMTYGDAYVAAVGLGYDFNQCVTAIKEALSYNGPSLILAYAPCINHGVLTGLYDTQGIIKNAVKSGYWPVFRYDPRRKALGKAPLIMDCDSEFELLDGFKKNELRYSRLEKTHPDKADRLFKSSMEATKERYRIFKENS